MGTVHEFTLAFAEGKVIGVLEGDWGTDDLIKEILRADITRQHETIIFDKDPHRLAERVIKQVKERKKQPTK
jgi:hypothetical protein